MNRFAAGEVFNVETVRSRFQVKARKAVANGGFASNTDRSNAGGAGAGNVSAENHINAAELQPWVDAQYLAAANWVANGRQRLTHTQKLHALHADLTDEVEARDNEIEDHEDGIAARDDEIQSLNEENEELTGDLTALVKQHQIEQKKAAGRENKNKKLLEKLAEFVRQSEVELDDKEEELDILRDTVVGLCKVIDGIKINGNSYAEHNLPAGLPPHINSVFIHDQADGQ